MIGTLAGEGHHFYSCLTYNAQPEKCAWVEYRNLPTDDPVRAAKMMRWTSEKSQNNINKPLFHYAIAWAHEDTPSREQMLEVADRWLEHMGLEEYQVQIASHQDKPYHHLHLAINRVHPTKHTAWDRWQYKTRSETLLKELEQEFGWEVVPGKHHPDLGQDMDGRAPEQWETHQQQKVKGQAAELGLDPAQIDGRSVMERANAIKGQLFRADSFTEFDRALAEQGLWLETARNKKGMLITDGRHRIKASDVSRQLSGPKLEETYGESLPKYVDRREGHVDERGSLQLAVDWKSGLQEAALERREQQLTSRQQAARQRAETLAQMDKAFTEEISREYRLFDMKFAEAFDNGDAARQTFFAAMKDKPMDEWIRDGQDQLINTPEQFGVVTDPHALVEMTRDLRAMERIAGQYQQYFTEGLDKGARQQEMGHARGEAKKWTSRLKRARRKLYRHLEEQTQEADAGRVLYHGSQEALGLYRAVQRIHQAFDSPQAPKIGHNKELDQTLAKTITRLDHHLEIAYEDPSQARQALRGFMWTDKTEQLYQLLRYPDAFGPLKESYNRTTIREAVKRLTQIRNQYQELLSGLSPDEVAAYFHGLPDSLQGQLAHRHQLPGGVTVTGLELMKASRRWLGCASGTEAGRVVFSMSARAVKYSVAVARMLRNPGKGPVSLTKHVITEAIRGGLQAERERDRDQGLSR
ncbi:relaxase/mobilization nuclease domain-containing protein [Fodinibius sediminis]|uniref:Relaxase/Mobilisation nuclease domain-containing protein n=1 Tax=Fodinibius sediminis TaxID=1214077 RepID=A0A521ATR9_9BACT|nr:relaxase/mobilization nuclease domain-containing protein [Fodinibius sediminis]SMO38209.1 Relaxase/Mobilisation nuclease domain-containing protein [Fodinibius sediminis]